MYTQFESSGGSVLAPIQCQVENPSQIENAHYKKGFLFECIIIRSRMQIALLLETDAILRY